MRTNKMARSINDALKAAHAVQKAEFEEKNKNIFKGAQAAFLNTTADTEKNALEEKAGKEKRAAEEAAEEEVTKKRLKLDTQPNK